jgi:DNA primase
MLWARENEAGSFETPERRAALEARLGEVTAAIGDETVRRYYRQEFAARLRRLFAPVEISAQRQNWREKEQRGGGARRQPVGAAPRFQEDSYTAASAQLAAGPLHRGHRAAIPRREALILQTALNHPWLLHDRLEELAETEFRHAETQKLKTALIDIVAHFFAEKSGESKREAAQAFGHDGEADRAELVTELSRRGFSDVLARIERSITTPSVWGARAQAAAADVLSTWRQLLALHRQWHSLTRELKEAELALGLDNSEVNYTRLRDVKARLTSLDGTEALIEGFGASSGRPARSL